MAQNVPNVEIVEQPTEECRFRYEQESRTNGSILGVNSSKTDTCNKTYPTIRVNNYVGPVEIRVSCVAKDPPYRPHPHMLVGRTNCEDGVCKITADITERDSTVQFRNIGIQCTKKNKVTEVLQQRQRMEVDPFGTGFDPSTYYRLSLHHVRLAFQVFIQDPVTKLCTVPLESVASYVITDHRKLCVVHASGCSGSATGGTQITLLTEKLNRWVSVHFFEAVTGWQAPATILRTHYMHALVINTPPYRDPTIREPVNVFYYLSRPPSGDATLDRGCTSELYPFTYTPPPERMYVTKSKRPNPDLLRIDLDPKRPNDNGKLNLQNETKNCPVVNTASPLFLEIPPQSDGEQEKDPVSSLAVAEPSHCDPLDWLQVKLIYPELQRAKVPLQSVAGLPLNEPPSTPRVRVPSTPLGTQEAHHRISTFQMGQVSAGRNHHLTSQTHGLVGQVKHDPPGLKHRPMRPPSQEHISSVISHAPMEHVCPRQAQDGRRKFYGLMGQVELPPMKHPFLPHAPVEHSPISHMKHPVLSHSLVEYSPISQSLEIGRQMEHALPDLRHLSTRPPSQDHNISSIQSHVTMEQVCPSPIRLPIDQSHGLGGQIGHYPQGHNHDPVDFCAGLDNGAQIGHNALDDTMSHMTFMEQDLLGLPHNQEGYQEIIDLASFDLDAEALACLMEAQSTDYPSCELSSLSFLDEEIRVNLSDSMSKM